MTGDTQLRPPRGRASVRKVVLANAYAEKTKGDLGIMCGTIEMLRQLYPDCEVVALRITGDHLPQSNLATLQRLYGVRQVSSCLPTKLRRGPKSLEEADKRDLWGIVRQAAVLGEDLWGLLWATVFGSRVASYVVGSDLRQTIRAIADADLVVTKGGGYLNSPNLYSDFQLLLPSTYTWWLAKQLGVPLAIIGQSMWSIRGPMSHRIIRPLVDYSLVTTCREPESREHLLQAGYPAEKVRLAPCPSFAMGRAPEERGREIVAAEGLGDAPLVGVSIRYVSFPGKGGLDKLRRYLRAVAKTVQELHRRYGAIAVIVPQNIPPGLLGEDDHMVDDVFLEELDDPAAVRIVLTDYTPHELVAFYSQFRILIGTRLHACVFALRGYTPVVAIAYAPHKTTGVMGMLGLRDYVVDVQTITAEELTAKAVEVWEKREELTEYLKQIIPKMERDVWNNLIWADEALAARQGAQHG